MILRSAFSKTSVLSRALTLRYPYLPLEEANASTTSCITAFPSSGSSTLRRGASASPADRSRRIAGLSAWPASLFSGRNAAMPPSRYALTRLRTEPFGGPLLPHAARHRFDRLGPRLQRDDGFRHMAGIPGILCRPAFQALPGRISQVLDHLGRGHRRGGVQIHRALSFLGTGHMIILSSSLQEKVRTLFSCMENSFCKAMSKL